MHVYVGMMGTRKLTQCLFLEIGHSVNEDQMFLRAL